MSLFAFTYFDFKYLFSVFILINILRQSKRFFLHVFTGLKLGNLLSRQVPNLRSLKIARFFQLESLKVRRFVFQIFLWNFYFSQRAYVRLLIILRNLRLVRIHRNWPRKIKIICVWTILGSSTKSDVITVRIELSLEFIIKEFFDVFILVARIMNNTLLLLVIDENKHLKIT